MCRLPTPRHVQTRQNLVPVDLVGQGVWLDRKLQDQLVPWDTSVFPTI